jgi:hypothetical protein
MSKVTIAAAVAAVFLVASCQALAALHTGHGGRWFDIVNNSNRTIVAVHANHVGGAVFYDVLNASVLPPRGRIRVAPQSRKNQGYCRFDIQVEFSDGALQNIPNVNLCEAIAVETFSDTGEGLYHKIVYPRSVAGLGKAVVQGSHLVLRIAGRKPLQTLVR